MTGVEETLNLILEQVSATHEVIHTWEHQRIAVRGIIQAALTSSLHLKQEPDYHEVLRRIADVLNVALLPSLERYAPREKDGSHG